MKRYVHVETIGERSYLCSDSHEERPGPGHVPVCDVTGIDAHIVQNACTAMNYALQDSKDTGDAVDLSLGKLAYELYCSLNAIHADWPAQDQEMWQSWALDFRDRIYQLLMAKPLTATYDSKTIGGRIRNIGDYQIEAYFAGSQPD